MPIMETGKKMGRLAGAEFPSRPGRAGPYNRRKCVCYAIIPAAFLIFSTALHTTCCARCFVMPSLCPMST